MKYEHENAAWLKYELREHLEEVLRKPRVFHGRPTQRLAAMIAAQLIDQDRHNPWRLCETVDQIDELRRRLVAAKV